MKPKLISSEIVVVDETTDLQIAAIMQEVATLIYDDVTQ